MPSISLPTAVLLGGTLAAGSTLGASYLSSNAAKSAAQAQAQAAQNAENTQLSIFNQTQSNLAPYNTAGQSALSQLASIFGLGPGGGPNANFATSALTNFPGYKFGFQQGIQGLDRSAASQGLLLSGGQLKAAQEFGNNYAMSNAWQPYISQLSGLSSLGENAAATAGNQGVQTGSSLANTILAGGQANASGIIGSNNAITSGLTSGVNSGLNSALLAYALQNPSGSQNVLQSSFNPVS